MPTSLARAADAHKRNATITCAHTSRPTPDAIWLYRAKSDAEITRCALQLRNSGGAVPGTYAMETLLQGGTYTVNWFLEQIAMLDAGRLGLGLRDVDLLETAAARLGA